jgi:hypothetical protein
VSRVKKTIVQIPVTSRLDGPPSTIQLQLHRQLRRPLPLVPKIFLHLPVLRRLKLKAWGNLILRRLLQNSKTSFQRKKPKRLHLGGDSPVGGSEPSEGADQASDSASGEHE